MYEVGNAPASSCAPKSNVEFQPFPVQLAAPLSQLNKRKNVLAVVIVPVTEQRYQPFPTGVIEEDVAVILEPPTTIDPAIPVDKLNVA